MRVYFSGIGGVGIGPLAEIAHDAGYNVCGSDKELSLMSKQLADIGVQVSLDQSGEFLKSQHIEQPFDWFVYTAALPNDHPELVLAKNLGICTAKRDELLAHIIEDKNLKMIAVAGTHGKTTTTGMLVWAMKQLNMPISYSIGTTIAFGPSGRFDPRSEYFVYECDEFDHNFLNFYPWMSIITALDYDHPDTYPTIESYREAFIKFFEQSNTSLVWQKDLRYLSHPDIPATYEAYDELMNLSHITLPGVHTRQNAFLVEKLLEKISQHDKKDILEAINSFPGTARRFERLAPNIYTDYGHHPVEIGATLQLASELSDDVTLVYQPHQNMRQHDIIDQYTDEIFKKATNIYWLPTFLTRENPDQTVLTPQDLSSKLSYKDRLHFAEMNDELWQKITQASSSGSLVLCMGAGTIDSWVREKSKGLN